MADFNGDGRSPSWQWLTGVFLLALFGLVGLVWGSLTNSINVRFDSVDRRLEKIESSREQEITDRATLMADHDAIAAMKNRLDNHDDYIVAIIKANKAEREARRAR